jgi:formylglycine-generating enzyme
MRYLGLIFVPGLFLFGGCSDPEAQDFYSDTDAYADSENGVDDRAGINMALIPAETFTMGSPRHEVGRFKEEETQHEVSLTRPYFMGVFEVSQAEFERFMGYQPSQNDDCANCPVENISWYEAAAFTNAVSTTAGLAQCYACTGSGVDVECELLDTWATPYDCPGYRLPTEAEWEHAARAGSTGAFDDGESLKIGDARDCAGTVILNGWSYLDDIAHYCGSGSRYPLEVGMKAPNAWGLYDVHGNVYEWCHDAGDGSDLTTNATDPWGTSAVAYRMSRGGSYHSEPRNLRSATRSWHKLEYDSTILGFRLARTE